MMELVQSIDGEVINIRDVVTFQGQSVDELRQALADSVEDYLAFCAERGEAPDQPFSGRFTRPAVAGAASQSHFGSREGWQRRGPMGHRDA